MSFRVDAEFAGQTMGKLSGQGALRPFNDPMVARRGGERCRENYFFCAGLGGVAHIEELKGMKLCSSIIWELFFAHLTNARGSPPHPTPPLSPGGAGAHVACRWNFPLALAAVQSAYAANKELEALYGPPSAARGSPTGEAHWRCAGVCMGKSTLG